MVRKHQVEEVLKSLSKKQGVKVSEFNKTVTISKNYSDLGNGSWGKIDFLVNHKGYRMNFD